MKWVHAEMWTEITTYTQVPRISKCLLKASKTIKLGIKFEVIQPIFIYLTCYVNSDIFKYATLKTAVSNVNELTLFGLKAA